MNSLTKMTLAAAVGVLALMGGIANADPLPPDGLPLESGMVFSVGDKTFTINSVKTSFHGTASVGDLTVVPQITFIPGLGNVGIGFVIQGSVFAAGLGSTADVLLNYHVHVDDPALLISDAHLYIAGSESAGIGVDEVLLHGVDPAGSMHVTGLAPVDSLPALMTGPVADLDVTKDIFTISLGDLVQWSAVGQLFTQVEGEHNVPEPLTLLVFGAGLAGVGFARRRNSKAS